MANEPAQSYATHRRWVPAYHFVLGAILLANVIWSVVRLVRVPSADAVVSLVLAAAFVMMALFLRVFPVTVQDRLIRLEETLRFERLLPGDLQRRVAEFTREQFIGLRFASDEELPELARKVLSENIQDREAIKKLIRTWRPDTLRA